MRAGMPREWFSAAELAEMSLPGLPASRQKIAELAVADGWHDQHDQDGRPCARPRGGRGGGFEYHVSVLPLAARETLALRQLAANDRAPCEAGLTGPTEFETLSANLQVKARERLAIIKEVSELVRGGSTQRQAVASVGRRWRRSVRTIYRYLEMAGGSDDVAASLPSLAPRHGGGGRQVEVDPEAWQVMLTDYLRLEKPAWEACYRRLVEDYCAPRGLAVPISKTLWRRLHREVPKTVIRAKRYGKEAERKSIPAQERTVADLHALYAVNIDGHTADVFVHWGQDSKGNDIIARPVMIGIQDIYSRKFLSHRIEATECTLPVRLAFADLFREYGIPEKCVLDNGRAFASKAITGAAKTRYRFKIKDDDPVGILTQLAVDPHWTLPYRGSSKPVERGWKDFCEDIAKHPFCAGAYTGNKPDAKPENYRSRAIPLEDFRAFVAERIRAHNARPQRRTEMGRGLHSFDDVFAASYAASVIRKATPEEIGMALLEASVLRVNKDNGVISLFGNRYWSWETHELAGDRVMVRFDPENLHGDVMVFNLKGDFLCRAPVIEKTGFFDKAGAVHRKKLETEVRRKRQAHEDALQLLDREKLVELLSGDRDPDPLPSAGAIRPIRSRGQTAAALKPVSMTAELPSQEDFTASFAAAVDRRSHLKSVK